MIEDTRFRTRRVGDLGAANRKPTAVKPDDRLEVATEIMRSKDFSQLPVMSSDSEVEGMITWKSIGERASTGSPCQFVRECMDGSVNVMSINSPLLDATKDVANGYVLVRGEDGVITGIVTASDFAVQFRQLAEPFLVIEEIEYHLRRLVDGKFCIGELRETVYEGRRRYIHGPDDLNLGAYCRLLEGSEHWKRLGLDTCQEVFLERLCAVRDIRNAVMPLRSQGSRTRIPAETVRFRRVASRLGDMRRQRRACSWDDTAEGISH